MTIDALNRSMRQLLGDFHPCASQVIGAVVGFGAETGGGYAVGVAVLFDCIGDCLGFGLGVFSDCWFDGLAEPVSVPFVGGESLVGVSVFGDVRVRVAAGVRVMAVGVTL